MATKIDMKVVGEFNIVEVREATTEDGITSYERRTITPADDTAGLAKVIVDKCKEVHTAEIKTAYLATLGE